MDLDSLREQIDNVDKEIIAFLNKRVQLACEVGHIKRKSGQAIYVPSREEEVFRKLCEQNKGPINDKAVRAIYREIIAACWV